MKVITHNNDNMEMNDMNKEVGRVKVLIINSDNELLLKNIHDVYKFPGGNMKKGENLNEAIKRDVLKETGIKLDTLNEKQFMKIEYLTKDYPVSGENTYFYINYYVVNCDKKFDLENITLTEDEKEGNFNLEFIKLDKVLGRLKETIDLNDENKAVVPEMETILKELFRLQLKGF